MRQDEERKCDEVCITDSDTLKISKSTCTHRNLQYLIFIRNHWVNVAIPDTDIHPLFIVGNV